MHFIGIPFTIGSTTVLQVSYKGNLWDRRENSKHIHWFKYVDYKRIYVYQYIKTSNTWKEYFNDKNILPKIIDTPYIENSYLKNEWRLHNTGLYSLFISHFNGNIEGLFIAKAEDVANIIGKSIYFTDDELSFFITPQHITKLDVRDSTIDDLLKHFNNGTISGYNVIHMMSNQLSGY